MSDMPYEVITAYDHPDATIASDLAAACVDSFASFDAQDAPEGRVWRQWLAGAPCGQLFVFDPSAIYRPRHPKRPSYYALPPFR